MKGWLVVLGAAAATYVLRVVPLLAPARVLHTPAVRALRHVPPALFAALIASELFTPDAVFAGLPPAASLVAGALLARRTRSVPITVLGGLAVGALVSVAADAIRQSA